MQAKQEDLISVLKILNISVDEWNASTDRKIAFKKKIRAALLKYHPDTREKNKLGDEDYQRLCDANIRLINDIDYEQIVDSDYRVEDAAEDLSNTYDSTRYPFFTDVNGFISQIERLNSVERTKFYLFARPKFPSFYVQGMNRQDVATLLQPLADIVRFYRLDETVSALSTLAPQYFLYHKNRAEKHDRENGGLGFNWYVPDVQLLDEILTSGWMLRGFSQVDSFLSALSGGNKMQVKAAFDDMIKAASKVEDTPLLKLLNFFSQKPTRQSLINVCSDRGYGEPHDDSYHATGGFPITIRFILNEALELNLPVDGHWEWPQSREDSFKQALTRYVMSLSNLLVKDIPIETATNQIKR